MIRYALHCDRGHEFESWFQDSAAYDRQVKRKLVACPVCDSVKVEKAIMAPQIQRRSRPRPARPSENAAPTPMVMSPEQELRTKLRELRDFVKGNAEDVGQRFPAEARKMHYGEIKHRPIYGQATTEDAKALVEEGVDVMPLPTLPEDRN